MKVLLCSTAAASFFAAGFGIAQAQDADWAGAYVGAQAGYTSNDNDGSERVLFDTNLDGGFNDTVNTATGANAFSPGFCDGAATSSSPTTGCSSDDDGFEFGARAGYDWRFGSFVVGPVVEVSRTDVKDSVAAFSTTPAQYTMSRKLKGVAALRVRGGYAFGDNLIYATGGVAKGDIQHSFNTTNTANTFVEREDDDAAGYQVGGGFERMIAPQLSLGVEYLYTNLEDDGYRVRAQGPAPATNPFILVNGAGTDFQRGSDELKYHAIRVTTAYRF